MFHPYISSQEHPIYALQRAHFCLRQLWARPAISLGDNFYCAIGKPLSATWIRKRTINYRSSRFDELTKKPCTRAQAKVGGLYWFSHTSLCRGCLTGSPIYLTSSGVPSQAPWHTSPPPSLLNSTSVRKPGTSRHTPLLRRALHTYPDDPWLKHSWILGSLAYRELLDLHTTYGWLEYSSRRDSSAACDIKAQAIFVLARQVQIATWARA
jgi:hypothetical protein